MRHGLRAVDEHDGAGGVRLGHELARRGSDVPSAFETCASATIFVRSFSRCSNAATSSEPSSRIGADDEPRARALAEQLPRHDVRVVLEPRDQHFVARLEALAEARGDQVDRLRGAAREDDFRASTRR